MTLALPKPEKRAPAPRRPIARRTRPRQRRKGLLAAMKRECWRLLSLIVRTKHPICQSCHCRPSTDGAHIFGRSYESVRLVELNVAALCRNCHRLLGSASLVRMTVMENFARRLMGDAAFESLAAKAATPCKFSPTTLEILSDQAMALGIPISTSATRPRPACSTTEETGRSKGSPERTIKGTSTA